MERVSDTYHKYYDSNKLWEQTTWLGVPCWKLPLDAFIYQEIICKVKPDIIIETGTAYGGSAVFFASICELIGKGRVVTIDIENRTQNISDQEHKVKELWNKRVTCLMGSSIEPEIINLVSESLKASGAEIIMVVLDSWHSKEYVSEELRLYSPFVTVDSYLVVEDTHIHNPIDWMWEDGPKEAVDEFLEINNSFITDYWCEKLVMTFNPGGWLKRIKNDCI
jgi:cephalosporin hydroxylase